MTQKQSEILGLYSIDSKVYPNRYYCTVLQRDVDICPSATVSDVMAMIYKEAFSKGVDQVKRDRTDDFRRMINGEDLD